MPNAMIHAFVFLIKLTYKQFISRDLALINGSTNPVTYKILSIMLGLSGRINGSETGAKRLIHEVCGLLFFPGSAIQESWDDLL